MMGQFKWISTLALVVGLVSTSAYADNPPSETRTIDATVSRIYFGGIGTLQLHQGPTPSLVVYGDSDTTNQISTVQNGDSLRIETHGFFMHVPSVRIDLTLPQLTDFMSNGVGTVQISGFSGDNLQLTVDGTGEVSATVHYKHITARSSGVAAMTLNNGDSDSIDVNLPGAGHMLLTGKTKALTCHINGVGSLDAKDLKADTVTTYLNGVGSAKVYAKDAANMYLHGVGSATVYGNPTVHNAQVSGFGKVNWDH